MIMMLCLLKRRADIDRDEFIRRYETGHARLGERLLRGRAERYVRRYLDPLPGPGSAAGEAAEPDHDVATEVWFADRAGWEAAMAHLADPAIAAEVAADEETLFDRARNRFFLVDEHDSAMGEDAGPSS